MTYATSRFGSHRRKVAKETLQAAAIRSTCFIRGRVRPYIHCETAEGVTSHAAATSLRLNRARVIQ